MPRPTVHWLCNGTEVTATDRIKITDSEKTYKIVIMDLKESDAGDWKCVVKNRIGERVLENKLDIIRKYKIIIGHWSSVHRNHQ